MQLLTAHRALPQAWPLSTPWVCTLTFTCRVLVGGPAMGDVLPDFRQLPQVRTDQADALGAGTLPHRLNLRPTVPSRIISCGVISAPATRGITEYWPLRCMLAKT